MILIAIGADASANNLGKIVVKSIDDISAETASLLSFFGKTWTDEQKVLIDDFLENFSLASWKSKVKVLVMPILMPAQNNITNVSGNMFKKNIATLANDLTLTGPLLDPGYGYLGISANGFVLQMAGANFHNNVGVSYTGVNSYGITNKAMHFGVYYISPTVFRAGSAGDQGLITSSSLNESGNVYNSFKNENVPNAGPHKNLFILNANVTGNTGKSYIKDKLVTTTILGTAPQVTVGIASPINGGGASNTPNVSTSCLMTFGEYMTDSELTEYANMINTLMDALIVE